MALLGHYEVACVWEAAYIGRHTFAARFPAATLAEAERIADGLMTTYFEHFLDGEVPAIIGEIPVREVEPSPIDQHVP